MRLLAKLGVASSGIWFVWRSRARVVRVGNGHGYVEMAVRTVHNSQAGRLVSNSRCAGVAVSRGDGRRGEQPKFFSSFLHSTCSLSVSHIYLALEEVYLPLRAAIQNNPTL